MTHLDIYLLGTFQVFLNGVLVANFRSVKVQALLCYLVLAARPVSRANLREIFWPEQPQELANANLRQSLSRLQKAVRNKSAAPPFLLIDRDFVAWNEGSSYSVDVHLFESLLRSCAQHGRFPNVYCRECQEALEEANTHYQGEFLAPLFVKDAPSFEEWQASQRENLHQAALQALNFLVERFEIRGDYSQAIHFLNRMLQLEPWREEYHGKKMRLLARQGKRIEAIRQYEACHRILADEFNVAPSPDLEKLYQSVQVIPEERPFTLPHHEPYKFVGRQEKIAQIHHYLFDPARRFISIIGPGGMGKTTIATKVGHSIVADRLGPFTHGVFFIPCLPDQYEDRLISVQRLQSSLVTACNIRITNEIKVEAQIQQFLGDKELLLIVDGAEYLGPEARTYLAKLIEETTAVKILATSREKLRLSLEWVIHLGSLSFPPKEIAQIGPARNNLEPDTNKIQTYEAIQLFLLRARQTDPTFSIHSKANAVAVTQIAQLVEGLPLGIELAAAWVGNIAPQKIAVEIKKSINILATENLDFPKRHASMYAVFEWSWHLLSEAEKGVLRNLSVFQGGFDFQAAEQVANASLNVLSQLLNKSLLMRISTAAAEQYQMHSLLQQFLYETKTAVDQTRLSETHSKYFANYLTTVDARRTEVQSANSGELIKQNIENIRTGWHWAVENKNWPILDLYLEPLYRFYAMESWWHEGLVMFQKAALLLPAQQKSSALTSLQLHFFTRLITRFSEFHFALGDLDKAELNLKKSEHLAMLLEDPGEYALVNKKMGMIAHRRGNFALAIERLTITISILEESEIQSEDLAHTYMSMGAILRDQGDQLKAQELFSKSRLIYQELGLVWGIAHATRLRASVAFVLGNISEAKLLHQESLTLFEQIDNQLGVGLNLIGLGLIAARENEAEMAEKLLLDGQKHCQQVDDQLGVTIALLNLGELMMAQKAWQAAREYFLVCFNTAVQIQATSLILQVLFKIALLLLKSQSREEVNKCVRKLLLAIFNHPLCVPSLKTEVEQLLIHQKMALKIEPVISIDRIRQMVEQSLSLVPL